MTLRARGKAHASLFRAKTLRAIFDSWSIHGGAPQADDRIRYRCEKMVWLLR